MLCACVYCSRTWATSKRESYFKRLNNLNERNVTSCVFFLLLFPFVNYIYNKEDNE